MNHRISNREINHAVNNISVSNQKPNHISFWLFMRVLFHCPIRKAPLSSVCVQCMPWQILSVTNSHRRLAQWGLSVRLHNRPHTVAPPAYRSDTTSRNMLSQSSPIIKDYGHQGLQFLAVGLCQAIVAGEYLRKLRELTSNAPTQRHLHKHTWKIGENWQRREWHCT